jgi:ADP-ribosyl-[dinitrogen reductase] hydrolase
VKEKGAEAELERRFAGVLLGTAVGDALGLPAEGLSPETIRKRWAGEWRMRLVFGRGMVSDDTEHTTMVAQALLGQPEDENAFQSALGWKLRWWFAALPGGVGLATARACLKLWMGVPAGKSGVASGGSGPAMRSAILGAFFADEPEKRRSFVLASSRLTHRGWQAETAALAVAEAAALTVQEGRAPSAAEVVGALRGLSAEAEWQGLLTRMESGLARGETVAEFASGLGLSRGVSGYALHVAPVALYAWQRHAGDFRMALTSALDCGGDTDTVGAIAGALAGVVAGKEGIPREWLEGICEWPRSCAWMERVAGRLAAQRGAERGLGAVGYFWPGLVVRNVVFLGIVICHGVRRGKQWTGWTAWTGWTGGVSDE